MIVAPLPIGKAQWVEGDNQVATKRKRNKMKLVINNKTLQINEKQLAAINAAIADAPVVKEHYNEATKEYEFLPSNCRLQIKPVETLENVVTLSAPM